MPPRKSELVLPEDCDKLDISICEHPKLQNKCKVRVARFGGRSRCVPNQEHLLDQEIQKQGFKNFAKIDTENLDQELSLRDKLCRQLSTEYCVSPRAQMLGCGLSGRIFKKHCKLSQKIIDFYYTKKNSCIMPDCKEIREKYKVLCFEHQTEFDNMFELLIQAYEDLTKHHEDDDNSLQKFEEIYLYLKDYYGIYLLDKVGLMVKIEEMALNIRRLHGSDSCECYNISSCISSGSVGSKCQKKMIKSSLGYVCNIHKKCIEERLSVYKKLRDNFEIICKKQGCGEILNKIKELYSMIKFSVSGEISVLKSEIYEMIMIIEEYVKEIQ